MSWTTRWRCDGCFDSGAHTYADQILEQLETEKATAFVPPLWRYEVSAVLARSEIRRLLSARKAAEFLEDIAALDIRVDDESASHCAE